MADNNSILAAYLASRQLPGGQRDPLAARERLAATLSAQGSSTEPVRSWGEGLARALQGGIGGLLSGYTEGERRATETSNQTALADYIKTGNPDALKGMKGELGNMLSAQLAGQRMTTQQNAAGADSLASAYGMPAPGAAAAAPQSGSATGAPTPLGPLPAGSLPAGDFANNTGNIRASNVNWDGKGAPQNGFETFSTPQAGVNAQFKNFQAYAQANPQMTVAQALAKWAPPNENDTNGYIAKISEESGVNPGQPLAEVLKDPMVASRLLDAQTRLEKGGMPQGVTADTFIAASGGGAAPGMPGQIAQPPTQVAQGSGPPGDGSGTPVAPTGPTPPAIPNVPRPQANPADVQRILAQVKAGKLPAADAQKEIEAGIDRQWNVDRERAKMEFDLKKGEYDRSAQQDFSLRKSEIERKAKAADEEPQNTFKNETKMRNDFATEPAVKSYRAVVPMLESAKDAATRPTRAADLNLVYAFAKLMDPDSVVRESETAGVVATASVADRLQAYIGQLNGQAMLNPDVRAKLMQELDSRFSSIKSSHDALASQYTDAANAYGFKPERIIMGVRTGQEKSGGQGNQPTPDELNRWAGGRSGSVPPPPPGFRPL